MTSNMVSSNQQISMDSRSARFSKVNAVRTFPIGFEKLRYRITSKDNAKDISLQDHGSPVINLSFQQREATSSNQSFQQHEASSNQLRISTLQDKDNAMSSIGMNHSSILRSQDGDDGLTTNPSYSRYKVEGLNQPFTSGNCVIFGKRKDHRTSQDYVKLSRRKRGIFSQTGDSLVPSHVHHKAHMKYKVESLKHSPRPTSQDYVTLIRRKREIFSRKGDSPVVNQSHVHHKAHMKDSSKVDSHLKDSSKVKILKVLHLFREVLERLLQDVGTKECYLKSRVPMRTAKLLEMNLMWINTSQRIGDIPGIEVGDKFNWMAELNVVGLHHQYLNGIDYMPKYGKILATSIVASGRYANSSDGDSLIYSGHGGNPSVVHGRLPKDQKLERGNLALKNSMEEKTPVRVIRGLQFSKKTKVYVYDGLYYVNDFWQEKGPFGKFVFKFSLKRIIGQPKLPKFSFDERMARV